MNKSKHLRFNQLSDSAKDRARTDYKNGWLETHPEEAGTYRNDDTLVSMDDDALFSNDGAFIGEAVS